MAGMKFQFALGVGLTVLFVGAATIVAHADGAPGGNLSQAEIFTKARETYAALGSYSDQGMTVANVNGITVTTTFTTKLARPNFYRISWQGTTASLYSTTTRKPQSVWSAGDGDFLDMGAGPKKQQSLEMALSGATGISGGAAATIPSPFFNVNWGNRLGGMASQAKQQADEKVGDADCYVFTDESKGRTSTLWIGKTDFLIHQVRNVTSGAAMQALLDATAKRNPEATPTVPKVAPQGVTSTETHTNIVLNPRIPPTDFGP